MEISEFSVRMIFLFLPGIICYLVIESLSITRRATPFRFVAYAFVLGMLCYLASAAVVCTMNIILWLLPKVQFQFDMYAFSALFDSSYKINVRLIIGVSLVSVALGGLISFLINKKCLHRLARSLHITRKFAELDVWGHVLDSPDKTEWVTVRDIKNGLVYEGWVEAFSDTVANNEMFLRDVIVFSNITGAKLYETPGLYVSRNRDDVTIEFGGLQFTKYIAREVKQTTEDPKDAETRR